MKSLTSLGSFTFLGVLMSAVLVAACGGKTKPAPTTPENKTGTTAPMKMGGAGYGGASYGGGAGGGGGNTPNPCGGGM